MNKPEILSERYVRGWNIACILGYALFLILAAIYFMLEIKKVIPPQTTKVLLFIAIAIMFEIRRRSVIEHQKIFKAISEQKEKKD